MRRWPTSVLDEVDRPPADKLKPIVEVWLTPAEIAAHTRADGCLACPQLYSGGGDCDWNLLLLAYRRHGEYRRQWLAEHQVDRRDQCKIWPVSAPRWGSHA